MFISINYLKILFMASSVKIIHKEHGLNPITIEVGDPKRGAKASKLVSRARRYRKELGLSKKKVKIVKK
jgi:hypothetical protein